MKPQAPPDTRPGALVLGGLRRGSVAVFLPIFLAGQAVAWLAYLIGGWYRPWSWVKIGLAYALMSVRVPFTATARVIDGVVADLPVEDVGFRDASLEVALGAFTVVLLVLMFRAGREQAKGLDERPAYAALAGSLVGLGFALPMFLSALLVRLSFPNLDLHQLKPVLWAAAAMPLAVGGLVGAAGGVSRARGALEERSWGARVVGAARGGYTALWWGVLLAFLGFLILAVVESGATRAYGRTVGGWGNAGAVTVVHHALLLPNQSVMMLGTTMGVRTELVANEEEAAVLTLDGVNSRETLEPLLAEVGFGPAYLVFLLVPAIAVVLGGRTAGEGARSPRERALRGALAGLVFGSLYGVAAWAAAIVLPLWPSFLGSRLALGAVPVPGALIAAAWGVVGCAAGAMLPWRASATGSA